jgi:hypothetical protein
VRRSDALESKKSSLLKIKELNDPSFLKFALTLKAAILILAAITAKQQTIARKGLAKRLESGQLRLKYSSYLK